MTIGYACEKMGQVVVLARCRILLRHLRAYRGIEARRWNEPLQLRVSQCMCRYGLSTQEGPSEHHEGLLRQEGTGDTKSSVRVGPLPRRVHVGGVLGARTFQYPDNPQGPAKARELPRRARRRPLQLAGPDGYADRVLWRPISSQPNRFRRTAVKRCSELPRVPASRSTAA